MLIRLFRYLVWILLYVSSATYAASPSRIQASYDIYKGGLKLGQIEETFSRDQDRYTIISTTRATGLMAVFKPGKITISSSGIITGNGLRPLKFSDLREGDEHKNRRAEFDWATQQLTLIQQEQPSVVPLPDGTQDRLSAMYQFVFLALEKADTLNFSMTNGRKLDLYQYRITAEQTVKTPLGTFKALYVASVPEAGANTTEIWLAVEHANFPYKMTITDPDGGQLTQELTKIEIVP